MNVNLFKLALERLESSDWAHFEKLCSAFLVAEFAELRTMAHSSGDGGRDSELFSPNGSPFIASQYSVASGWKSKIRRTVSRITSEFPEVRILLFMSNQTIGGQADEVKKETLAKGISLDVRDRNWFLERATTDSIREAAAEELIDRIARPYLQGEEVISKGAHPLTSGESRAALLYLGLQLQDDRTDKGLTKLSFDALVRAALRHTNSDRRLPRKDVHVAVLSSLPTADPVVVVRLTDAALARLAKRYVRHWPQEDGFCLTYDESQRMVAQLAEVESQMIDFTESLKRRIKVCINLGHVSESVDFDDLHARVQRIIQRLFLRRGELFVQALQSDTLSRIGLFDLDDIILKDLQNFPTSSTLLAQLPEILRTVVKDLLTESDEPTHRYLRRLGNSYTLFAFLNHTPDVQAATRKLFSHGTVWVDTTILLPLLAEFLKDGPTEESLSTVFRVCHDAGIELRVTRGVIQEINAHMNNCLLCSQYSGATWKGRIPYLYNQYLLLGRTATAFRQWLEQFRGSERPDDDLAQFLGNTFGFKLVDLDIAANDIPKELRYSVDRLWSEAHKQRRQRDEGDEATTNMLIKHDIETYLGVLALRQKETVSELGYRHWLLALDTVAWDIRDYLRKEQAEGGFTSPLLSLSFLISSMTFGTTPLAHRQGRLNDASYHSRY